MRVDPPKDEGLDSLLQEVHRTLQENQRFLSALREDQLDVEELGDEVVDEEFEEL